VVPVAAGDPGAWGPGARVGRDRLAERLRRGRVLQVELPDLEPAVDEVRVPVVQPGQQQAAARLDHARPRADERPHVVVAADAHDPLAAHGHRARPGARVVHREHVRAQDDQVRRLRRRRGGQGEGRERRDGRPGRGHG
jgi:hypothetical protein